MRLAAPLTLAGALLALTSCSSTPDPAPAAGADTTGAAPRASTTVEQDPVGAANYRLTMDKVDQMFAALRDVLVKTNDLPEAERNASRVGVASLGVLKPTATPEVWYPVASAAIQDAGLSVREFALIYHTMMRSLMANVELGFRPNASPDSLMRKMGVSTENLRFVQENHAELARRIDGIADDIGRLGIR
jgi:hypothetical protein